MFMALRQKAGIWLSKKQRLPSWRDAKTQHLCPPSFLALLSPHACVFSLLSARPARVWLPELGLLLSLLPWPFLSLAFCVPCPGSKGWEINPKGG